MTQRETFLERIADAMERLAPPASVPTDWDSSPGYRWTVNGAVPVTELDAWALETLRGIDKQKQAVVENVSRLAAGHAAHDMLLWGARGMGKSALLRSAVSHLQSGAAGDTLAVVEVAHDATATLLNLFEELDRVDRAFVALIDDLGFGAGATDAVLSLRSALEGGIVPRPANVRIAVTSNRRAIVTRMAGEQASALSPRDERDDALALADRFGLSLGFHPCDRDTYLEIVRSYLAPLGLEFEEEQAIAWSITRGALSGRVAHQFAVEIAGRAGKPLS